MDECHCHFETPRWEREILKTKYLIAADGGHSTIREQLAMPFLGSTHPVSLFVTDCKAEVICLQIPSVFHFQT